ncbi:MAG: RsmB/NOP family class I SAM-dependent RNA methyltransferase [Opitutaceae bacterium]|nr:RsmB/NOP family class I SAM-dependent RNA methyltransferase [Opitutaceae bacterium]
MTASATLSQATRVLRAVAAGARADDALRALLPRRRFASSPEERRAVSRAVFTYYRWWRWLAARDSLPAQLEAALALQARFDRDPAAFKPEALAARAVPDWLKDEMDSLPPGWLRQLQREPTLWIRIKRGHEARVTAGLGDCHPTGFSGSAFRYAGRKDLFLTPEFRSGLFEIQDLASQLVGLAAAPRPGETWWDACAGEGGKTLHLSDLMANQGLIWASDRSVRRLAHLKERAARAQAFNFRAAAWDGGPRLPTKTKFDGILVDAPCSGIGTWQRNPHARWTTQPLDIRELAAVQARLLGHVAGSLKPGGRLVYAVCTLTRAETAAVAAALASSHPELEPAPVILPPGGAAPASGLPPPVAATLWPQDLDANGMFIATWRRN